MSCHAKIVPRGKTQPRGCLRKVMKSNPSFCSQKHAAAGCGRGGEVCVEHNETRNSTSIISGLCSLGKNINWFDNTMLSQVVKNIQSLTIFPVKGGYAQSVSRKMRSATPQIKYNNKTYDVVSKVIGSGGYGKVLSVAFRPEGSESDVVFAVKVRNEDRKFLSDHQLLKKWGHKPLPCQSYIVPMTKYKRETFVIMPLASGTLDQWLGKCTPEQAHKVVEIVQEGARCLFKQNLVYVDIKPDNILYVCSEKKVDLFIGDLGSLQARTFTYIDPRPEVYSLLRGSIPTLEAYDQVTHYSLIVLYFKLRFNARLPGYHEGLVDRTRPKRMISDFIEGERDIYSSLDLHYVRELANIREDLE